MQHSNYFLNLIRCVEGSEFLIEEVDADDGKIYNYSDLGCQDWPLEFVEQTQKGCGRENRDLLIEIGFAVSNHLSKVLITACLDRTTYQSLWSRHVVPKVIDQRNFYGDMPYFSDDGLYDFQLEVYKYYTKDMQRYLNPFDITC